MTKGSSMKFAKSAANGAAQEALIAQNTKDMATNWLCNCVPPRGDIKPLALKRCNLCGMKNGDRNTFPYLKTASLKKIKTKRRMVTENESFHKCDLCRKSHKMFGSLCNEIISHFGWFDGKRWQITEAGIKKYKQLCQQKLMK